jgi:hypothetical protein
VVPTLSLPRVSAWGARAHLLRLLEWLFVPDHLSLALIRYPRRYPGPDGPGSSFALEGRLNVSPTTVKRRIRAGTLEAEQLVSQAETIGTLRSERDTARAEVEMLKASQALPAANSGPEAPAPTNGMPRYRSWPVCEPGRRDWWPCWRSSP